jgi:hypothetical protein
LKRKVKENFKENEDIAELREIKMEIKENFKKGNYKKSFL